MYEVKEIFKDCLYRPEEVEGREIPKGAIVVEGITFAAAFNPKYVARNKDKIGKILDDMDDAYGTGCSFLYLCFNKEGEQWTGSHRTMEELMMLGMAIGRIRYCCGRALWEVLPGKMPYIFIEGENNNGK